MKNLYYTVLTNIGKVKLAKAIESGRQIDFSQMAIGDGGGNPVSPHLMQTSLINEVFRAPLSRFIANPNDVSQSIAELELSANTGGWWIRECGLFDKDGDLVAVANVPEYFLDTDSAKIVSMALPIGSLAVTVPTISPDVIPATHNYVNNAIIDHEQKLDPHPLYWNDLRGDAKVCSAITIHEKQIDPHYRVYWNDERGYVVVSSAISNHEAKADPHKMYWNDLRGDTKVFSAITIHENKIDPHYKVYWNDERGDAKVFSAITIHENKIDPHKVYWNDERGDIVVSSAISNHEAKADPHTLYWNDQRGGTQISSAINIHENKIDPHTLYWNDQRGDAKISSAISAHKAEADPHAQYAPKVSPNFSGTPTSPTPVQFDNSSKIATTSFVNRQGFCFAGQIDLFYSTTLTAENHAGMYIVAHAEHKTRFTITLPMVISMPRGSCIAIYNCSDYPAILNVPDNARILGVSDRNYASITIQRGESVILESNSFHWLASGSGALYLNDSFAALKAEVGYQRSPSGIITQWGIIPDINNWSTTVYFPIAFPNKLFSCIASLREQNGGTYPTSVFAARARTTGFNLILGAFTSGVTMANYIATGY